MRINLKTNAHTDHELQRRSLQKIASAIESEEQWREVLAKATPEQAEELERVVGPLLPFRCAGVCTTPDCTSGKVGAYQPVLVVSNPQRPEEDFHVPIELTLCEDCMKDAALEDFLTDALWSQVILAWPHGEWPPVRRRTKLRFDRVH